MADRTLSAGRGGFFSLPLAMRSNGLFCSGSGLALLLLGGVLAAPLGIPAPLLMGTGAVLVPYGLFLVWYTRDAAVDRRLAGAVIALDLAWVGGSVALLLSRWLPLTPAGQWSVGVVAELVFLFAVWQAAALRRRA